MDSLEDIYASLTDEQKEQVKAAKTPEEMLGFAKEHGVPLSIDQLESVAGGSIYNDNNCPNAVKDS